MDEDLEALLPGIQYAETRGEAEPFQAVGDAGASKGAFQIKPIMYADIQRIFPEEWTRVSYDQMQAQPDLQRKAALAGFRMLRDHYKLSGDFLMSAWNTGPTEARKGILNKAYVATVKEGIRRAEIGKARPQGSPALPALAGVLEDLHGP